MKWNPTSKFHSELSNTSAFQAEQGNRYPAGLTSFRWQIETPLDLGKSEHKIVFKWRDFSWWGTTKVQWNLTLAFSAQNPREVQQHTRWHCSISHRKFIWVGWCPSQRQRSHMVTLLNCRTRIKPLQETSGVKIDTNKIHRLRSNFC